MGKFVKRAKDLAISTGRRLPEGLRNSLFHFAYACAPAEFERFAFLYASGQEQCLRQMARNGFHPRTIVDVGAYRGDWSRMAHAIWPDASVVMVEPNREQSRRPRRARRRASRHPALRAARAGRRPGSHIPRDGDRLLGPARAERRAAADRDPEARHPGYPARRHASLDLLKIDAQGYELSILDGAAKVLPKVQAVLLETALLEVNEGSPILHEVVRYMHDRGFVAFDVLEMHRRWLDRALCQIDILFCREDSAIRANKRFC